MSELVLCINLKTSREKKFLVFETYSTTKIKTTKTKQFSGQLQKIDFSLFYEFDNITPELFKELRQLLYADGNIQFSKYQFSITVKTLSTFKKFINLKFIFYCDNDNHFHLIEFFEIVQNNKISGKTLENITYIANGNSLCLSITENKSTKIDDKSICAKLYIDMTSKRYNASLFFMYANAEIRYDDSKISEFLSITRNYYFEKHIVSILNKNDWHLHSGLFEYSGKNIISSISKLQKEGINLYTNTDKKHIYVGRFTDASISYNIDWFEFNATIQIGDKHISANELFNLKNKKNNWIEIDKQLVFLPKAYYKYENIFFSDAGHIKIAKKNIGHVLAFSNDLNIKSIKNMDSLTDITKIKLQIHPKLKPVLKEYQKIGVQWLMYLHKNNFGGCLADDMGLGKTIQVLAYLSDKTFENSNNLIIVPKTLLENWSREILKFLPDTKFYIYHNKTRDIQTASKNLIILTTYGVITNDFQIFCQKKFENIIIDEAQNIKNYKSIAYKNILKLNAKTKLLLTGTPFENNIREFMSLMNIANPGLFTQFPKSIDTNIISKIKTISSPFVLQRLKKDVLKELPEKKEETIYCSMDTAQRELYDTMLRSIQHEIKRKTTRFEMKSNSLILNGLLYLQQICCHPKLLPHEFNKGRYLDSAKTEMVMNMIQSLCSTGHKTIIFSRFTKMLKILTDLMKRYNIDFYYLDGQTENRLNVVDNFEKSVNSVFLVSLKAGGTGLNLTSADTAIIYDPWWNPAIEKQAEDRLYRIGQKKKVIIYRLIMSNSIEEKIQELKLMKKDIANQILENEDSVTEINMEILRGLILEEK